MASQTSAQGFQRASCDATASSTSDIVPCSKSPIVGTKSPSYSNRLPIEVNSKSSDGPYIIPRRWSNPILPQYNPHHDSKNAGASANEFPNCNPLPLVNKRKKRIIIAFTYIFVLCCLLLVWWIDSEHLPTKLPEVMKSIFSPLSTLISFIILNTICTNGASVPPSFPKSGKVLWFRSPGVIWAQDYLPVGNGYLAGDLSLCTLHGRFMTFK